MTTYHETSCTECEALKLNNCDDCDMAKWRTIQNGLAWLIATEMIAALTAMVYYALLVGSATESFMRWGDATYAAKVGSLATFVGLVILFMFRESISKWVMMWADTAQRWREMDTEDNEDEDDE